MGNIVGIALFSVVGLVAWSRRGDMTGGPRRLLSASLALLGIAVVLLSASLMLEVPDSRGLFLFLALVAIGVLIARSVQRRGRVRAAETAGYTVRTQPRRVTPAPSPLRPGYTSSSRTVRTQPRRVTPAPSPLRPGYTSSSRTVRDIENMEVQ